MRRVISILLCLCLLGSIAPIAAAITVASGECGENLTWTLDSDGTLVISGNGDMEQYDVSQKGGGAVAPWRDVEIGRVVIEEGVTSIGSYAFFKSNLTSVSIPSSVKSIGAHAFLDCESLRSVSIAEGVERIEESAFNMCVSLEEIELPESLAEIGTAAFGYCGALKGIVIPRGVTRIETAVFASCTDLRRVVLPEGMKGIGTNAFLSCESLQEIDIPASVTEIGEGAFCGCESLTRVRLPYGITSIEASTFSNCLSLRSVTLPKSVTYLGEGAFSNCESLIGFVVPESVTDTHVFAFRFGCASLKGIAFCGERRKGWEDRCVGNIEGRIVAFYPRQWDEDPSWAETRQQEENVLWYAFDKEGVTRGLPSYVFPYVMTAVASAMLWTPDR